MADDWIMPEYMIISGQDDAPASWGTEIEYDDEEINACRKDTDREADCQTCIARARCAELVREEWARESGTEPPEEVGK